MRIIFKRWNKNFFARPLALCAVALSLALVGCPVIVPNLPPSIENQTFTANEDIAPGAVIERVLANDPEGNPLIYRITRNSPAPSGEPMFAIHPRNGDLRLAEGQTLDYETIPSHSLTVQVSDGAQQASAQVTITVNNINESPVVNEQVFNANEDIPAGSDIDRVIVRDPDVNATLTFTITQNSPSNEAGLFRIDPTTGMVGLASGQNLDYETEQQHTITVQVQDNENLTATAQITIMVNNINDNAPVISSQTFNANENITSGTAITTVQARDADIADTLTFAITTNSQSPSGENLFTITNDGVLILAEEQNLDYETRNSHTIIIQVTDNGNITAQADITIQVNDGNDPPTIEAQTFSVNENILSGSVIHTVQASDSNNDSLTFTIQPSIDSTLFSITNDGILRLATGQTLDYETEKAHTITVQVSDRTFTNNAQITINVMNVNEAPTAPIVQGGGTLTVAENITPATVIGTITATDPDAGDTLTYSITTNSGNLFEIDPNSGDLRLSTGQSLNFETQTMHSITVQVSDSVNPPLTNSASFTIAVTDILYEPPTQWTELNNTLLSRIHHVNNIFIAFGRNGTILTSTDGIDWDDQISGTTQQLSDITYGSNTFVAVGGSGTILTSADGQNWISRRSGTTEGLREIIYANNTFVAVGGNGTILTSADGQNWTSRRSGTTEGLQEIIYANNIFVVVGTNGIILTSTDGIDWDEQTSGTTESLNSIIYANNTFVAIGGSGTILTSTDGQNWVEQDSSTTQSLSAITYGSNTFVAIGSSSSRVRIITSTNGTDWDEQTIGFRERLYGIIYANNTFVAVGNSNIGSRHRGNLILTSTDGTDWDRQTSGTTEPLYGITYANNIFVAVGDGRTILNSRDGQNWTIRSSGPTAWLSDITYGDTTFVAVGLRGRILTSPDGQTWIEQDSTTSANLSSITYGRGAFVTVSSNRSFILSSGNGQRWVGVRSNNTRELSHITYISGRYYAFGFREPVLTSNNIGGGIMRGINTITSIGWIEQEISTTTSIRDITYGSNTFVVVGNRGTIWTSRSGLDYWTSRRSHTTEHLGRIIYANNTFVAVGGNGTILTSADGQNWTSRMSGTTEGLWEIIYANNTFVAVGGNGTILTSADGIDWDEQTSGTTADLVGIVYGNNTFIAVGGRTILIGQ